MGAQINNILIQLVILSETIAHMVGRIKFHKIIFRCINVFLEAVYDFSLHERNQGFLFIVSVTGGLIS